VEYDIEKGKGMVGESIKKQNEYEDFEDMSDEAIDAYDYDNERLVDRMDRQGYTYHPDEKKLPGL